MTIQNIDGDRMSKSMQKVVTVPCKTTSFTDLKSILKEVILATPFSKKEKSIMIASILETIKLMMRYPRERTNQNDISATFDVNNVRFKAVITDSCNIYELEKSISDTQVVRKIHKEKDYRLGIPLLRVVMDEISYTYRKGFENELTLIKFIP
jgi:cysteinyl-tRNA synthetase